MLLDSSFFLMREQRKNIACTRMVPTLLLDIQMVSIVKSHSSKPKSGKIQKETVRYSFSMFSIQSCYASCYCWPRVFEALGKKMPLGY